MADPKKSQLKASEKTDIQKKRLEFDEKKAGDNALNAYVVWLDLMGAGGAMSTSMPRAAHGIMKIHHAALAAQGQCKPEPKLFPINDGVFCVTDDKDTAARFMRATLWILAEHFITERKHEERCLVRGAIAYGKTILGSGLQAGLPDPCQHSDYFGRILMGMPVIQAVLAEKQAPPFGVFVHESARGFAANIKDAPFHFVFFRWFDEDPKDGQANKLDVFKHTLTEYFEWLGKNLRSQLYQPEAHARHWDMASEYFHLK